MGKRKAPSDFKVWDGYGARITFGEEDLAALAKKPAVLIGQLLRLLWRAEVLVHALEPQRRPRGKPAPSFHKMLLDCGFTTGAVTRSAAAAGARRRPSLSGSSKASRRPRSKAGTPRGRGPRS